MNLSREEAQQILDALDAEATEFICDFQASEPPSHLRAAIAILRSRLAEGEQEPVAVVELVHQPMRGWPDGTWRQAEPQLEIRAIRPIENGQRLYAAPQGEPK